MGFVEALDKFCFQKFKCFVTFLHYFSPKGDFGMEDDDFVSFFLKISETNFVETLKRSINVSSGGSRVVWLPT